MKVFFISGIGADERLFNYIQLPAKYEVVHIPWIPSLPGETLAAYGRRLFLPYNADEPFALVGLSLGGIVSVEIAKLFNPVCTILLSSVPAASRLPSYYRLIRKLRVHRLMPPTLWKITAIAKHYLTMKGRVNKRLMRSVIWEGDTRFIHWGINAVLEWDNEVIPQPLYHIHGTRDEVFPIRCARPTHVLPKAGHMAVFSHAETINAILPTLLQGAGL